MKRISLILFLAAILCGFGLAQSPYKISQRCPTPNGSTYGSIAFSAAGNVTYTPCPTKTSIFTGNVDFSAATVTGLPSGSGTVTNVSSANGALSVSSPTTTPVLTVNSAPILTTARTIGGISFNGSANVTVATATGGFTISGGDLALGANNLSLTGSIGSTGSRSTKGWFTDLQVTNAIAGSTTGNSTTIASGTSALATGAISSATCASAVTTAATGTLTTDAISWGFNGDPTAVTGYVPLTAGMLTIIAYPSAGNVNFKVCNNTSGSITPGAITLNWRIVR